MIQSAFAQSTPPAPGSASAPAATAQATTQAPSGAPQGSYPPSQPGFMNMLLLFAPMFLVIYFFIIRPQNKKMKEHRALVEKVKSGDEIVTAAGIFGTVTGVTEKVLTVEIADGVKIKLLKSQVATVNPSR